MILLRVLVVAVLAIVGASVAASADPPHEKVVDMPRDLEARLMRGAFGELDALAAEYRSSGVRIIGGTWALKVLYDDLSRISEGVCGCGGRGDIAFDDKRKALERWLAANPSSLTARIALAELWNNYAWAGRGGDSAHKTSDTQWKDFYDRMGHALDLLKSVDPNADPEVYLIEMDAAPVDEQPREHLLELYDRAVRAFPTVPEYAMARFNFTLDRWFGEPGEAAAFTPSLLTSPGGQAGLIAYFDVAKQSLAVERNYAIVFEVSGANYATLVKAFAARSAAFGVTKSDMNVLMFYAVAATDKKTAAFVAKKIGDSWDSSVWGERKYFDAAISWTSEWP